jgi:1-acyl-sn-glycerol-3-phosphate acyltransferase
VTTVAADLPACADRRPPLRPLFTVAVYAWAASLLCLHALVALVAMPCTLIVDRDRRFAARLGSWLTRTAIRVPRQWRGAARGLSSMGTGPRGRPAVIVMNHRSLADIAMAVGVPGGPKIVSKPWPGRLPLIGMCMRLCGHVVFDPSSPHDVLMLMKRAEGLLARGESVLFFPEGTRRTGPGMGAFHEGAFLLAVKMRVDVLPVVLHGTGRLVPKGSLAFHDVAVDATPLPRMAPGLDRRALARRVRAAMAASLAAHA